MRFYHVMQFNNLCLTHCDNRIHTLADKKKVCSQIVEKAKRAVKDGEMVEGIFEVQVCDDRGREVDDFISGTDYVY